MNYSYALNITLALYVQLSQFFLSGYWVIGLLGYWVIGLLVQKFNTLECYIKNLNLVATHLFDYQRAIHEHQVTSLIYHVPDQPHH